MNNMPYHSHDRFYLAVDCIIFGFDGKEIKALLIKRSLEPQMGKWSLMGLIKLFGKQQ
jgi:ADP-ribose pyrophosphatase YjhB (NUDIX family)